MRRKEFLLDIALHFLVVEHVHESVEGFDYAISTGINKLELIKHQNKLNILHLLEHSIQEVRNTHDSDVVPSIFVARHVDECGLII